LNEAAGPGVIDVVRIAILLLCACESTSSKPPTPSPTPAAAPRVDAGPPILPTVVKEWAYDDHAHTTETLAPILAKADACIPVHDDPDQSDHSLVVAIDAFGGKLVACAQQLTREGGSVFLEPVSYACWDVDPATGKLSRRADLARSYFMCQDGCDGERAYGHGQISYDGKRVITWDDDETHPLEIYERKPDDSRGAKLGSVPATEEGHQLDLRGPVFVGDALIIENQVFDLTGKAVVKLPEGQVRVVDETHVIVIGEKQSTLYDTKTHKQSKVAVDAFTSGPVRLGTAAFALSDRSLVILDGKTFKKKKSLPLATCP
jgi:hypothetical protein